MHPVYRTPKSSTRSPDDMASCPPRPPRRGKVNVSLVGPEDVPALKLRDDADNKLEFFLTPPANNCCANAFVPITHCSRHYVPILKLRPRPSWAFTLAAPTPTRPPVGTAGKFPTFSEEEEGTSPHSNTKVRTALSVTSTTTTSVETSYELSARKRLKMEMEYQDPSTSTAMATSLRPTFSSRAK